MDIISQLITNPALLLLLGLLFFAVYIALRNRAGVNLRSRALLWPGVAWTLWALWEFGIARFSPDADIRVDLFLIIPAVLIITVIGIIRLFWTQKS